MVQKVGWKWTDERTSPVAVPFSLMRSVCSADVDEQWYLTLCLHFTAGSATSWVSCTNEPSQAVLERASQDAFDVIRLMHSKAAVWTVDDVARLI